MLFGRRHFPAALLALCLLCTFSQGAAAQKASAEDEGLLRTRANESMTLGTSLAGIGRMEDLFKYAEYLHRNGHDEQASLYLEEALCRKPWDFERQLLYARMLIDAGNAVEGERRARFVAQLAEDGETVAAARRILGAESPPSKITQQAAPPNGPAILLIPVGKVEAWLLLDTAKFLQERLGIPAVTVDLGVGMPTHKRDGYRESLAEMRKRITSARNDPALVAELKRQNLVLSDLQSDDVLDQFVRKRLEDNEDREKYLQTCKMLDSLKADGKQWEALDLLQEMKTAVSSLPQDSGLMFLGVTGQDIYSENSNYLYSLSLAPCSILSYWRYQAAHTGEPPNRERLFRRFRILCLSNVGHRLDIKPCSYPTCPHSFQISLPEHDAKEEEYCPTCRKAIEKALGRPLPQAAGQTK